MFKHNQLSPRGKISLTRELRLQELVLTLAGFNVVMTEGGMKNERNRTAVRGQVALAAQNTDVSLTVLLRNVFRRKQFTNHGSAAIISGM